MRMSMKHKLPVVSMFHTCLGHGCKLCRDARCRCAMTRCQIWWQPALHLAHQAAQEHSAQCARASNYVSSCTSHWRVGTHRNRVQLPLYGKCSLARATFCVHTMTVSSELLFDNTWMWAPVPI